MSELSYKIEKGIPAPDRWSTAKYPFLTMEVGDSFFVSGDQSSKLSAAACQCRRRSGMVFMVRKMDGGVRCWRIA